MRSRPCLTIAAAPSPPSLTNADGSYHHTAGSVGTFSGYELGNDATCGYSLYEDSDTAYGFTHTLTDGSEGWTLIGVYDDAMSKWEVGDRLTGESPGMRRR